MDDHATGVQAPGRDTRPIVLTAIIIGMFMAAVEATVVATAMPTIVHVLGGFRLFPWLFSIYVLTQAVTVPIYGRLADIFGRKPVYLFGTTLFLGASVLCGLAVTMPQLIVFRGLQGIGAGAIFPIALTIVGAMYTPSQRARIQGFLSSVWAIASI
ncbi:MAG: MFS transporter, partial [Thermaerobacterales bacterium]